MHTLLYYSTLAARDTLRPRAALAATAMIVLGVCLPLVLLLGLANGLVRQHEETMLRSPTACQLQLWVTGGSAAPLTRAAEDRLCQAHAGVALVIPGVKKVVDAQAVRQGTALPGLTLLPTTPGDPLLAFHHADVLAAGETGLVLSRTATDRLGVRYEPRPDRGYRPDPGQFLTVTVARGEGGDRQGRAQTRLEVKGVADVGEALLAYADRQFLDRVESYQQGQAVAELGWPACAVNTPAAYDGYLCFAKAPLGAADRAKLAARGLTASPLNPADPDPARRHSLGGLLKPHQLSVYYLGAGGGGAPALTLSPAEVEDVTEADDVVVPWSWPRPARIDDRPYLLVGVSVQKRWLRGLFRDPDAAFDPGRAESAVQFVAGHGPDPHRPGDKLSLSLPGGPDIPLTLSRPAAPPKPDLPPGIAAVLRAVPAALDDVRQWVRPGRRSPTPPAVRDDTALAPGSPASPDAARPEPPPVAVVPADFLARLYALDRGETRYDEDLGLFLPAPRETPYYQARVYARSLSDVPAVDAFLRAEGYSVQSERTRVEEIQGYARTLGLLVGVVGGLVYLAGVWNLIAVLSDNTARKRGPIGLLRAIGVGRWGVLYFVLARAVLIGLLAGALAVPVSLLLARLLTASAATCELTAAHLAGVVGVAVTCCLIGGLIPAVRASRLDPVDAITEGSLR
jgi:ABC-type lipoprotein release transport system permease subunit